MAGARAPYPQNAPSNPLLKLAARGAAPGIPPDLQLLPRCTYRYRTLAGVVTRAQPYLNPRRPSKYQRDTPPAVTLRDFTPHTLAPLLRALDALVANRRQPPPTTTPTAGGTAAWAGLLDRAARHLLLSLPASPATLQLAERRAAERRGRRVGGAPLPADAAEVAPTLPASRPPAWPPAAQRRSPVVTNPTLPTYGRAERVRESQGLRLAGAWRLG